MTLILCVPGVCVRARVCVCMVGVLWEDLQGCKQLTAKWCAFFVQAESHSMKNQQMDPFTRRQCKPTIVSNVSIMLKFIWGNLQSSRKQYNGESRKENVACTCA